MSKHTPGPWLAYEEARVKYGDKPTRQEEIYIAPKLWEPNTVIMLNESVAEVILRQGRIPQGEANARLIASAPELLEALKSSLYYIGGLGGEGDPEFHALIKRIDDGS